MIPLGVKHINVDFFKICHPTFLFHQNINPDVVGFAKLAYAE